MGRSWFELPIEENPVQIQGAEKALLAAGEWSGELSQRTKSGRAVRVQSYWTLITEGVTEPSFMTMAIETSQSEKIEAECYLRQRLESIGMLAAGVAHDLNNLLGPIRSSARLLQDNLPGTDAGKILSAIDLSAAKAIDLVRQVLAFARGSHAQKCELQIGYLIREIIKICRSNFPKEFRVRGEIPNDLWTLLGDPTQLHQMLLNLCLNARDAMPNGGVVRVSAKNSWLNSPPPPDYPQASPGPHLRICVSDTGVGIPPQVLDRIFEPFFTTKSPGQGTGLGLSTVLTIVKKHLGFARVRSTLNQGTHFEIYLPALPVPTPGTPEPAPAEMMGQTSYSQNSGEATSARREGS